MNCPLSNTFVLKGNRIKSVLYFRWHCIDDMRISYFSNTKTQFEWIAFDAKCRLILLLLLMASRPRAYTMQIQSSFFFVACNILSMSSFNLYYYSSHTTITHLFNFMHVFVFNWTNFVYSTGKSEMQALHANARQALKAKNVNYQMNRKVSIFFTVHSNGLFALYAEKKAQIHHYEHKRAKNFAKSTNYRRDGLRCRCDITIFQVVYQFEKLPTKAQRLINNRFWGLYRTFSYLFVFVCSAFIWQFVASANIIV